MSTNRYRKCAKCGHTPAQDESVAFHRFPKPGSTNILRATAWATFYKPDQDWSSVESLATLYKTYKVLCGRHFQDSCYLNSSKRRISKYAIPGTREYVIKLMQSLRSKIPSFGRKLVNSSQDDPVTKSVTDHPLAGTSAQQDSSAAEPSIPLINTSQDDPAAKHDLTHHPLAGTSTQQGSSAAEPSIPLSPPPTTCKRRLEEQAALDSPSDSPPDHCRETSPCSPTTSEKLRKKSKLAQTEPSEEFTWNQSSAVVPDVSEPDFEITSKRDPDIDNDDLSQSFYSHFQCNNCGQNITGFRYVCVQCADYSVCRACEAGGAHAGCYVLRAPPRTPEAEVQEMLMKIRRFIAGPIDEIKDEIKEEDPLDYNATEETTEEFWTAGGIPATDPKTDDRDQVENQMHVIQDGLSDLLAKPSHDAPTPTKPAKKVVIPIVRVKRINPTEINISAKEKEINTSTKVIIPSHEVPMNTYISSYVNQLPQSVISSKQFDIRKQSASSLVNLPATVINTSTQTQVKNTHSQVTNAPTKVIITSNTVINPPTKVFSAPSQVKGLSAVMLPIRTELLKKYLTQSMSSKQFPSSSQPVVSSQSAASGNINTPGTLATSASSRESTPRTSAPKAFIEIDAGTIHLPGSIGR